MAYISQIILPDGTTYDIKDYGMGNEDVVKVDSDGTLLKVALDTHVTSGTEIKTIKIPTESGENGGLGLVIIYSSGTAQDERYARLSAKEGLYLILGDGTNTYNGLYSAKKITLKKNNTVYFEVADTGQIMSDTLTANKILVADANKNIVSSSYEFDISTANTTDTWIPVISNGKIQHCLREIKSAVGDLGWGSGNDNIATKAMLAFWNGAYSGTGSNLAYCKKGAFGDMATANKSGFTMTGALNFANATWNKVGDDVQFADVNISNKLGIQGLATSNPGANGGSGFRIYKAGNSGSYIDLGWDGSFFNISQHILMPTGKVVRIGSHSQFTDLSTASCVLCGDSGSFIRKYSNTNTANVIHASQFAVDSSKLIKENVQNITEDYAKKLLDIRPVSFDYIEKVGGKKGQCGMIAEEVLPIYPECVNVPDGYTEEKAIEEIENGNNMMCLSIDYAKFTPYLIKMIQMQQQQINELKRRIEE